MPLADDLRQYWLSKPGILRATGGRISQLVADKDDTLPYVVFGRNSSASDVCTDGGRGPTTTRFDVSVRAANDTDSETIYQQIAAASDGFAGLIGEGTRVQGMFVEGEDDESQQFPDGNNEIEIQTNFVVEVIHE